MAEGSHLAIQRLNLTPAWLELMRMNTCGKADLSSTQSPHAQRHPPVFAQVDSGFANHVEKFHDLDADSRLARRCTCKGAPMRSK